MKLQSISNFRFLAVLLLVFVITGFILYYVLGFLVNDNLDETLHNRRKKIIRDYSNYSLDNLSALPDQSLIIQPTNTYFRQVVYSDTVITDGADEEGNNCRKITFGIVSQGKNYKVTLYLSKLETEDLMEVVFYFMLCLFGVIVLVLLLVNYRLSLSVWRPFYKTLDKLKQFTLNQNKIPEFSHSAVKEFEQLNKALAEMVNKAHLDYKNLKDFTENASHEIQTPLAIAKSKLESVLQDQSLPKERYQQVQSAFEAINRLSKLNEALLLLTKIGNKQFPETSNINLSDLIQKQLEYIAEIIDYKKISVIKNLDQPFVIRMNVYLAELLINNLLGNAVKHNMEGGQIIIKTTCNQLLISNTGKPLHTDPEKLFQRFVKHNAGSESMGLGLAIVGEICEKSGLRINYSYQNDNHLHSILVEPCA